MARWGGFPGRSGRRLVCGRALRICLADMAIGSPRETDAATPFAALHLVVGLLTEVETATAGSSLYDRLAEATCRLGTMERAVVFLYDDVLRRVRPVGAHGLDLGLVADARQTAEDAPLAARALERDRVLVAGGEDLRRELPAASIERLGITNLACVPLSAGGRGYGVVLADMGARSEITEPERELLWMLGKVSALAYQARIAMRQQERARQLTDRLDLARELHERVVQRVFGVSLALDTDEPLTTATRQRCAAELRAAQEDLRESLQRPLAPLPKVTPHMTLHEELERLSGDGLRVAWEEGAAIAPEHEALAQSVLTEAVRNARKHAPDADVEVHVRREGDAVAVEIVNDGVVVGRRRPGAGMGLRLAAFEALAQGGAVDFGLTPPDRWHVRLVLPMPIS